MSKNIYNHKCEMSSLSINVPIRKCLIASLNQNISYSTGSFSGAQVIDAAEHGTSGIVGRSGFWARSENRIKDAVDEAVANNF